MDHALKKLLYEGTNYTNNHGGKIEDIPKLTNDLIKEYHKKFYYSSNATIIICGSVEEQPLLEAVSKVDFPLKPSDQTSFPWESLSLSPLKTTSQNVPFPSQETDVGGVVYGWRFYFILFYFILYYFIFLFFHSFPFLCPFSFFSFFSFF